VRPVAVEMRPVAVEIQVVGLVGVETVGPVTVKIVAIVVVETVVPVTVKISGPHRAAVDGRLCKRAARM
jgi:hypothetical protein